MYEINEASTTVQESAHPEAEILWGVSIDESMGETVSVTIIATRFDGEFIPAMPSISKHQTMQPPPPPPQNTRRVTPTPITTFPNFNGFSPPVFNTSPQQPEQTPPQKSQPQQQPQQPQQQPPRKSNDFGAPELPPWMR